MKNIKNRDKCYVLFFLCFIVFMPTSKAKEKIYSIGVVPQFEVSRLQKIWKPVLRELELRTGLKFVLIGSTNIPAFENEFMSGRFDFAYMNPYHALIASKNQDYMPLVRDVGRKLFGVLVVRKDSEIKDIKELNGKTIAFPSPNALGASLLMRADLTDLYQINITPKYVMTHDSVYLNVAIGQAMAGGGVQKTFSRQKKQVKDTLRVLYQTRKVAPHPVVVHPRVPDEVSSKVKDAFIAMGETEEGRQKLLKIPIKKVGIADIKDYEPLSEMNLDRYASGN